MAKNEVQVGALGRLGGYAYRHRGRVILLWAAALAIAFGMSALLGGPFSADYSAPSSDSSAAQKLLDERFPAQSGTTVNVVVHSDTPVTDPKTRAEIDALLQKLSGMKSVVAVADPDTAPGQVSRDGRTAIAQLRLNEANHEDLAVPDTLALLATAESASRPGLDIALGGQAIQKAEEGSIGSEGIGLIAAAIILLLVFGSVVAAGLPLLVAITGLAVSSLLTGVIAAAMPVPDWSTALAAMMGIGIGIDYALLMVTRFREWRAEGLDPEAATIATLDTAGRSVLLAGATVMVSMFGLFAMGLSFMRGAAMVTIVAVAVVLAAALTLFPALLGYAGSRIDRLRLPLPRRRKTASAVSPAAAPSAGWTRWNGLLARHSLIGAVVGVALLLALASPFLGVRFGFPDAGNDPPGSSNRHAYELTADAFGAGANGPLVLAVKLPAGGGEAALTGLHAGLAGTDGVADVTPPQVNPAGDTAVLSVFPEAAPGDPATDKLVGDLRDRMLPAATEGTGLSVFVGGVTAQTKDTTANIVSRLPLLVGGVVLLSMLLLLVAFRSVAIAVKAAVMNLLSVAAAYGVVALVLQGGTLGGLVGIDHPTPLAAFVPVLMFAVLFGLSMDYEVFLIARMREAWLRTSDNSAAILSGMAGTAKVITAAAAIMVAVFSAFIPDDLIYLKIIGLGMASAIFIDATVVRLLLVPAVMHLLGRANWWLPSRLSRLVPQLHVEGRPSGTCRPGPLSRCHRWNLPNRTSYGVPARGPAWFAGPCAGRRGRGRDLGVGLRPAAARGGLRGRGGRRLASRRDDVGDRGRVVVPVPRLSGDGGHPLERGDVRGPGRPGESWWRGRRSCGRSADASRARDFRLANARAVVAQRSARAGPGAGGRAAAGLCRWLRVDGPHRRLIAAPAVAGCPAH